MDTTSDTDVSEGRSLDEIREELGQKLKSLTKLLKLSVRVQEEVAIRAIRLEDVAALWAVSRDFSILIEGLWKLSVDLNPEGCCVAAVLPEQSQSPFSSPPISPPSSITVSPTSSTSLRRNPMDRWGSFRFGTSTGPLSDAERLPALSCSLVSRLAAGSPLQRCQSPTSIATTKKRTGALRSCRKAYEGHAAAEGLAGGRRH
eukprot:GGOE01053326.1.p1 GENE.GGOE01053326.1~~GGOE01053326.1.p1  ORF type:complete len:202 (+),score=34.41 GGOE01053326.1:41-646(+)